MSHKIRVGVVMGGVSGEHEISIISAESVIKALNKKKYEVIPIGITKQGQWISGPATIKLLKSKAKLPSNEILLPDPSKKSLLPISKQGKTRPLDLIIPVLHGTNGEDGKIQGLFELANIPYVGSGVLGSAVGMDKIVMKDIFKANGLKTVNYIYFIKSDWLKNRRPVIKQVEKSLKYPVFVKPANLGSSVGINKAHNQSELIKAIQDAVKYDRRIIVEQAVINPREIECAVLGNDYPKATIPGEIIPQHEFYSYAAKYLDEHGAQLKIPAKLSKSTVKNIKAMAISAFKMLDLAGMARVDFLLDKRGQIYINEVNTIPGFTSISMYPKLWAASGVKYPELLDKLIELALERHKEKNSLTTNYHVS